MDSLIHGIIDCVAKPSSTDTPVRVLRKSPSESPRCVSAILGGEAEDDVKESSRHPIRLPSTEVVDSESVSRGTPHNFVLTAEGVLFDRNTGHFPSCASCGDCSAGDSDTVSPVSCNGDQVEEDDTTIDIAVRRRFEAAFATFLYKNPAFMSMCSHTSLQKIRRKLLRESARNVTVEAKLRRELHELRESKHHNELEIQKELLLITKVKAARESELRNQIAKNRAACLQLDSMLQAVARSSRPSNEDVSGGCLPGGGVSSMPSAPMHGIAIPTVPSGLYGVAPLNPLEQFHKKHQKMEEAHILAERVKIQRQIVKEGSGIGIVGG